MFYLTTHSTHFIYGYMASDIWLRTILIVRKETRCHHIGYSFRLARVSFYMHHPSDRITYTTAFVTQSLAGMRNTSMVPPWGIDPSTHRTMSGRSYNVADYKETNFRKRHHGVCCYNWFRVTEKTNNWHISLNINYIFLFFYTTVFVLAVGLWSAYWKWFHKLEVISQ